MSHFISLSSMTAEEFRSEARKSRTRSAESFDRSDTDGFLSQWGSDTMARAYDLAAELIDAGKRSEFFGARDIETGKLVPGKWLDTRYGSKWAVFAEDDTDMTGRVIHWLSGGERSFKNKGLERVRVSRKVSGIRSGGSGMAVSYFPVPEAFSADDEILSTWAEWERADDEQRAARFNTNDSAPVNSSTANTGEKTMSTYTAPEQGFDINDVVRIGKGKANWTVVERRALGEYTLESEKGARRNVTRDVPLIGVRTTEYVAIGTDREGDNLIQRFVLPGDVTIDRAAHDEFIGENWRDHGYVVTEILTAPEWDERENVLTTPATAPQYAEREQELLASAAGMPEHAPLTDAEKVYTASVHENSEDSTDAIEAGGTDEYPDREATDRAQVFEMETKHADYPHTPGYLDSCLACTAGGCVCNEPCTEASCVESLTHEYGARGQHSAPCWSDHCERAGEDEESDACPACGNAPDYCPGHGAIGDPEGHAIVMAAMDADGNIAPVDTDDTRRAAERAELKRANPAHDRTYAEIKASGYVMPENRRSSASVDASPVESRPASTPTASVWGVSEFQRPTLNRAQRRAMDKRGKRKSNGAPKFW